MKTHTFFCFVALGLVGVVGMAALAYGQLMDWGQQGYGPGRENRI